MTKHVRAEEAQANLSALLEAVARGEGPLVIEQRGQPLATLVSLADLQRLGVSIGEPLPPRKSLSDVVAEMTDDERIDDALIDEMVRRIYEERADDARRQAERLGLVSDVSD